jgi:hypothetical protein
MQVYKGGEAESSGLYIGFNGKLEFIFIRIK